MERSWRNFAPEEVSGAKGNILLTGREAYLRTKELLDEASTLNDKLFKSGQDEHDRRGGLFERQDTLHVPAIAPANGFLPAPGDRGIGDHSLLLPAADGGADKRSFAADMVGGILSATSERSSQLAAPVRRPEEKQFCLALLELQEVMRRLPPGARVKPTDIAPILHTMHEVAWEAEQAAQDATARLRELRGEGEPAIATAAATAHELSLEKDTWALLLLMNGADEEDREIREIARVQGDDVIHAVLGPNASDEEVIGAMRMRDTEYRRTEFVVKWLHNAVLSRLDELAPAAGVQRGGSLGWSNTLESLAMGGAQKSEISQMHPDASLRKVERASVGGDDAVKAIQLVGQDDTDEEELMRTVWTLVRAGQVSNARELCQDRGQPWRAAAMSGGRVVGCENEADGQDEDDVIEEGGSGRDGDVFSPGQGLWQEMCWKLSDSLERGANNSTGLARLVAKYEAATLARLGGNFELLLASELTQSWDDQAWIHFTALLQRKVLQERIRYHEAQAALSSLFPGVASLSADKRLQQLMMQSSPPTTHSEVFDILDDTSRGRVRAEGRGCYRQAQQALIMGGDDISGFLVGILRRVASASETDTLEGYREKDETAQACIPSPQLLRFSAHLALLLAAQCPFLTMEDETLDAIHDVVSAYAEHLAKTQQVRLVAVYAAQLPIRRRRDLYANFLRSVDGDGNRRAALDEAKLHMEGDVLAILNKVVEDARLQPTVATRHPRTVPDGDLVKIKAMSWLIDQPDAFAEAVLQANALARHLVLQQYQESAIGGNRWASATAEMPWSSSPVDGADDIGDETPVILSARVEAVGMLLREVKASLPGRDPAQVGAAVAHEQECWQLLLEARSSYLGWITTREETMRNVLQEGINNFRPDARQAAEEALWESAALATRSLGRILAFQGGWMYPSDPPDSLHRSASPASTYSGQESSSTGDGAIAIVNADAEHGRLGMDLSLSTYDGEEDPALEERRKGREVDEMRKRRARREMDELAALEEAAAFFAASTRKAELQRAREACLPGVVFLFHQVAHDTGEAFLSLGHIDRARVWFVRAQSLANTVVKEEYRTLRALSPGHVSQLLHKVERSSTEVLKCDQARS